MIVEFFGLSRSGKTTMKESLAKKGNKTLKDQNDLIKFFYFLMFLLKHPVKTTYLFYKLNANYLKLERFSLINYLKMIIMRNSYLIGVLSKHAPAKKFKGTVVVDEYFIQSIFMILQRKSNTSEIKKLLNILPKSDFVYIVETDSKTRKERFKKTRYPAQWIEPEYAHKWMDNSEFNYKIIKKLLLETKDKVKVIISK